GEGLTIISDQHKGLIEAAKEVMPFAEHRQCARHIYANFRKKFTESFDAYQHLMDRQPKSWSRAFFEIDRACDAVENGISECFNSLIVDARKKPIINMLEDIRIYIMERQKRMRDKHEGHNKKGCKSSVDGGNAGTQAANGGVGRTKYMVRRGGSSAGRGCSSS
nr:hypothetical protein [Tanacetum cinerariifolium]